jgi:hypothetical protein
MVSLAGVLAEWGKVLWFSVLIPQSVENRATNGNWKAWQNDSDLENLSWPLNWKS